MSKYFVVLSGDNIKLARAEVESLVETEASNARISWHRRIGIIDCPKSPVLSLLNRAALVRETGTVLQEFSDIDSTANQIAYDSMPELIKSGESFSVELRMIDDLLSYEQRQELVRKIGKRIRTLSRAPVSLANPRVRIIIVVSQEGVFFCEGFLSQQRGILAQRTPSTKSFFHPSMMNSLLARVMCNIAGVKSDSTVLDPFCGAGGILCEAGLLGARVIGIDLSWKLLRGAKMNLLGLNVRNFVLIQGDSRFLPVSDFDCIVTDPPYGRTSSTQGAFAVDLVERLAIQLSQFTDSNRLACICGSQEMNLGAIFGQVGLPVLYDIPIRVHSGLSRELLGVKI
ncbi:MAG: methyltransferase domain-containing protein [Candidatus Thorarchaeota archaeon]